MSNRPILTLVEHFLKGIVQYAKTEEREVSGTAVVEKALVEKKPQTPIVVSYQAYRSGEALCWYAEDGKVHLYAIVNDTVSYMKSVLLTQVPQLMQMVEQTTKGIVAKIKKKKKS